MVEIAHGDMARSVVRQRQTEALKAAMKRHSDELVTRRIADIALAARGDYAPLAGIDASLRRIEGWRSANIELDLFLGAMQSSIATIDEMASDLSSSLEIAAASGNVLETSIAAAEARQTFEAAVGMLNTRVADRTVFAGNATTTAALVDAATMIEGIKSAMSGAVSTGDVIAAVTGWFDDPSGFLGSAFMGDTSGLGPVPVSEGQSIRIGLTAADADIRETLKGFALAVVLTEPPLAGDGTAMSAVASAASELLLSSSNARASAMGRVGALEGQVALAQGRNAAEATALGLAREALIGADPYEAAAALEAAETQLETLYTLTARISRLSLVNFLR
jgi:flagellar hook-associated protein 3 FlgL